MARMTKAKGKLVRRYGQNIFGNPKYDRLLKRRPGLPGEPKKGRVRQTEFGRQLLEKQKMKFAYGVSEKQFRNIFKKAKSMGGVTGHTMMILLERRLDNVIYRLGMGISRAQARQLVSHGHVHLNGRRMNIPSVQVRVGDIISIKDREGSKKIIRENIAASNIVIPPWLSLNVDTLTAEINALPTRDLIPTVAEEHLIVEFYSK